MAHGFPARDTSSTGFELSLANRQSIHVVDEPRLLDAARRVLADSIFTSATISLAVVDDSTIHALNRQFLNHDWPTDVLSFVLDVRGTHLDGEVVLSADTAATAAVEAGWSPAEEQLLYVIHGMLHLVGLDDQAEPEVQNMRAAERFYLHECGVAMPVANRDSDTTSDRLRAGGTSPW
jgi:probable rRNA maturation factor